MSYKLSTITVNINTCGKVESMKDWKIEFKAFFKFDSLP